MDGRNVIDPKLTEKGFMSSSIEKRDKEGLTGEDTMKTVLKISASFLFLFIITPVLAFLSGSYLPLSSSTVSAATIVIDDDPKPAISGLYLTSNYSNDSACIQAALDRAQSGDTIIIREGNYQIARQVKELNKNLNIIGEGEVTLNIRTGSLPGLCFQGSKITTQTLSNNAQEGSSQIILSSASKVRAGDIIRIWKNVKWCPLDYPDQTTGEIYLVKSVSGNIVTLNEPLLRDYNLSETVRAEIFRPVEMHISNIGIQNVNASGVHEGLELRYCKNSSVTDSWFKDNGQASLRLYTCFDVDVKNNKIYNSVHEGNGYGISIADSTAFVNIEKNHIENCRHTIMSGTADFRGLNRGVVISNNTLIGANIASSHVVDSHQMTIDYTVTKNKIYPYKDSKKFVAFSDGTLESVFSENEVYGGHGAVARRGNVNNGTHIIKDNYVETNGFLYGGTGTGIGDTLIIMNNDHNNGRQWYGVGLNTESFRNIIICGNNFGDLTWRGVDIKCLIDGVNLEISNNTFENIKGEGIYIDGNSHTNGEIKIKNNNLINVGTSGHLTAKIEISDIQNASICGNQIFDTTTNNIQYGIYEGRGSYNNSIFDNKIIGRSYPRVVSRFVYYYIKYVKMAS